jgi:hypothetical protein
MQSITLADSPSTQCKLLSSNEEPSHRSSRYLNGTDEWLIWRNNDASLYSRDRDEAEGVLFRVFYDWQQDNLNDVDANFRRTFKAITLSYEADVRLQPSWI